MPLILDRAQVIDVYAEAADRNWVLPTFNAENLTSCEAILQAVSEYGDEIGIGNLPIIIGITNLYPPRPQAIYYTQTRKWEIGMRLFLADLNVLLSKESPFSQLRVMIHLDHILWDEDIELLSWDMHQFSSIMYDASSLTFEQNIEKTSKFVDQHNKIIFIEGACDEIGSIKTLPDNETSMVEQAEEYYRRTGVDLIVANLGTEHRSTESVLNYNSNLALKITQRIGPRLCLHGTSSVAPDKLASLFDQGIRKVNVWTILERSATQVLFKEMVKNASKVVGAKIVNELITSGDFGKNVNRDNGQSLNYFTTTYRQEIVFETMKKTITGFLREWYK
jgi:fructose-bisphosphate aldolase class II